MHFNDLTDLDASSLSRAIHRRLVSCREVMAAYLARIHRINPLANAIVNLRSDEQLLLEADACDRALDQGQSRGWLHGIPQAIKDASHAAGLPTTFGSPLLRNSVSATDGLMARRMKDAGCIVIGKTNVPEFGLGSHSFNSVFGATPNAWDISVSAGGSSGGAAAALAHRLLPVADGSDFMGSLRNPAAWNHVFGLRPAQGRIPLSPSKDKWIDQLSTEGPMARSVRDLELLLATQAGNDRHAPLSIGDGPGVWIPAAEPADLGRLRIGWLGDMEGYLPVEDGILPLCESALRRFSNAGAIVEKTRIACDLEAVWRAWLVWRHTLVAAKLDDLLAPPEARKHVKPEAMWEYDKARNISANELMQASAQRTAFHDCMIRALGQFDVLALPVTQVWPFPLYDRWPVSIAGRAMDTYHRWMEVTIYATFAGLPALSLPAGFHGNKKWPNGLQLIGQPKGEAALLAIAAAYERLVPDLLNLRPEASAQ